MPPATPKFDFSVLRTLREQHELTLAALSEASGVSVGVISKLERADGQLYVTVSGRDVLALLEGAEFVLNNGQRTVVMHPVDGLLDGHEESFRAEFPEARAAGATSVEIILYDQTGNTSSTRLTVK